MRKHLALVAAVLAVSGCTGGAGVSGAGDPSPLPPPSSPVFTAVPTGSGATSPGAVPPSPSQSPITGTVDPGAAAASAAQLPEGRASGRMTLALTGLGQVESDVTGDCDRQGEATELRLVAGTAKVDVKLVPNGTSTVAVADNGLDMEATLLPGDYAITPPGFTMAATFQPAGSDLPGGRLDLAVTCAQ